MSDCGLDPIRARWGTTVKGLVGRWSSQPEHCSRQRSKVGTKRPAFLPRSRHYRPNKLVSGRLALPPKLSCFTAFATNTSQFPQPFSWRGGTDTGKATFLAN